jgi:hypothetical protein
VVINHKNDWEWLKNVIASIEMVMTGAWFMTLFYPHYSKSHVGFSGCEVLLWLGIRSQSSGTGGLWVACLSMSTWITKFSSIIQARLENISFSDLFRYSVASRCLVIRGGLLEFVMKYPPALQVTSEVCFC